MKTRIAVVAAFFLLLGGCSTSDDDTKSDLDAGPSDATELDIDADTEEADTTRLTRPEPLCSGPEDPECPCENATYCCAEFAYGCTNIVEGRQSWSAVQTAYCIPAFPDYVDSPPCPWEECATPRSCRCDGATEPCCEPGLNPSFDRWYDCDQYWRRDEEATESCGPDDPICP